MGSSVCVCVGEVDRTDIFSVLLLNGLFLLQGAQVAWCVCMCVCFIPR